MGAHIARKKNHMRKTEKCTYRKLKYTWTIHIPYMKQLMRHYFLTLFWRKVYVARAHGRKSFEPWDVLRLERPRSSRTLLSTKVV